jgi:hypothetical protein
VFNAPMKAVTGGAAECGGGGTAVPEPGTLGVMGFAAMAAGWRGKRRRRVDRFPAGFVGSGRRTSRMICHGRGGSL